MLGVQKQLILHFLTRFSGDRYPLPYFQFHLRILHLFSLATLSQGLQFDLTNGLTLISLAGITIVGSHPLAGLYPALGLSGVCTCDGVEEHISSQCRYAVGVVAAEFDLFQFGFARY